MLKKSIVLLTLIISLSWSFFTEKKLGHYYFVKRDNTRLVVLAGQTADQMLRQGSRVRLIKDDSLMEQLLMFPFRVAQLIFLKTPRGTWLVENENGVRGYIWSSELQL